MVEPPHITVLLFVSRVNAFVARALAYGHSLSASRFEAVTISTDEAALRALQSDWAALGTDVPLIVVPAADGEFLTQALQYIRSLTPSREHSVLVLLPELVVSHWYETILRNQTGERLKAALRAQPWVVVATLPFEVPAKPIGPDME